MVIATGTFGLILVIVLGTYWALVVWPEGAEDAQLKKRLQPGAKKGAVLGGLLRDSDRLSDVRLLNGLLVRANRLVNPMQQAIVQSGTRMTLGTVLLASGCLAGLAYLIAVNVTHLEVAGVVAALLFGALPALYVRQARAKRMLKFEEQFPEAIDLISRALRAGHALTTGLQMVAEELADPIRSEFRLLYDQQSFGMPLPDALRNFAQRIPSLDARFFVTALLTQREAGGNLSEVLDNLAVIIRDRFRVKRQVRVISAHGRITGWVLAGLPPSLGIALMFLLPENYAKFYKDPLGVQMLVGALVLQVIGTMLIRRIVNIEY